MTFPSFSLPASVNRTHLAQAPPDTGGHPAQLAGAVRVSRRASCYWAVPDSGPLPAPWCRPGSLENVGLAHLSSQVGSGEVRSQRREHQHVARNARLGKLAEALPAEQVDEVVPQRAMPVQAGHDPRASVLDRGRHQRQPAREILLGQDERVTVVLVPGEPAGRRARGLVQICQLGAPNLVQVSLLNVARTRRRSLVNADNWSVAVV